MGSTVVYWSWVRYPAGTFLCGVWVGFPLVFQFPPTIKTCMLGIFG